MHSRRGTNNDFGNDHRAYFQALYHGLLDVRASQYDNIFVADSSANLPTLDAKMIVPLADHEAEELSATGACKQSQSEPDWSEEDFAAYSSLGSELLAPATAIPHELIGEEISPPPLSLSSSSASEKDTPPVPSSTLELRKVRSNPPRGSASQGRPRRSSSVIVNDRAGGSSRISKSSANKPWPKDLAKNAPHPNQHVHAQERAKPGTHILKTIFVHRKSPSSESFTGITYTPITLSTLNPADLIVSLCRTFAIDPGSIGAISMWHDPHNGVHGMVDEMFLATLSNDQDIVFDLCSRHEDIGLSGPMNELQEPSPFILLEI